MKNEFLEKLTGIAKHMGYPDDKIRDIFENLEASDFVSLKNALTNNNIDEVKQILNKSMSSIAMESVIFENEFLGVDDDKLIRIQNMNESELYSAYQQIPHSSIGINLMNSKNLRTLVYIYEDIISSTQSAGSSIAPLQKTTPVDNKVNVTQEPVAPIGTSNKTNDTKVNTLQQVTNPIGGSPGPEVNNTMDVVDPMGTNNKTATNMAPVSNNPENKQEINGTFNGQLSQQVEPDLPNTNDMNSDENDRLAQLAGIQQNQG